MGLKDIRKRIVSVKSTQKITRAMKMVAGARLNRAQHRITALRPYAIKTQEVLLSVAGRDQLDAEAADTVAKSGDELGHPLLARRAEKNVLVLVITSDRGLCGAFNSSINRTAERLWRDLEAQGKGVQIAVIGRKGRDYLKRRGAPVVQVFERVWEQLDVEQARKVATRLLAPFRAEEVDSIYLVYNEFKSAMTQKPVAERLFPLSSTEIDAAAKAQSEGHGEVEYLFEPDRDALLQRLVPMYVETSVLRALLESMASELGARMTAMDSATKNASEMISSLTLQYNRARQAAITTELMEIIGGAEALAG